MWPYLMILVGFGLLIKGADLLVEGASSVARRLNVSDMVIGLTVVAFGTSTPELAVNLLAAIRDTTDIAIGNVVGSNIANILLILGVASLIRPLRVTSEIVYREIPMCLLAVFVLALLANDRFIDNGSADALSRIDGGVLLCFFTVFIYYTLAGQMTINGIDGYAPKPAPSLGRAFLFVTVGLAGLILLPVFTHCLIHLYQQPEGLKWLLSLLFLIWAADIGAYFTGRAWGKHKMIPQVSPGKSWEGLAGGLVSVLVIAGISLTWLPVSSIPLWFGLAVTTALVSVLGDLFFSVLKRRCGLKDTGKLLPGHGGILDRLDSLIAALPFFFWSLQHAMSLA